MPLPRRAKVALLIATVWVLSPIDLLPEFLPIIGPLDDVVAVVLLLRYAARAIPRDVLLAAWPAEPRLLERLLPAVSDTWATCRLVPCSLTGRSSPGGTSTSARSLGATGAAAGLILAVSPRAPTCSTMPAPTR